MFLPKIHQNRLSGRPGGLLGCFRGFLKPLGSILGYFGSALGAHWGVWGLLENIKGYLGSFWDVLEAPWAPRAGGPGGNINSLTIH